MPIAFLPIPAIDLMDGQVVRLERGEAGQRTVYSDDPAAVAQQFEAAGAHRLHVVDLDGAFSGQPVNLEAIAAIRAAVGMKIELGGGLRTRAAVEQVIELGIDYAILGTKAVHDRAFVKELATHHGLRMIIGIDARDGMVAVEGWRETSKLDALEFACELEDLGIGTLIYTDIATDGMLTGPNLAALEKVADAVQIDVIASGGVSRYEDLEAIRGLERHNLIGAIIGKAIYEGRLDLAEAVRRL